jgi:hypothetical protein
LGTPIRAIRKAGNQEKTMGEVDKLKIFRRQKRGFTLVSASLS